MINKREKRKANIELIGFDDRWLRILGIPILGLILPIVFFDSNPLADLHQYFTNVVISMLYVGMYWELDRAVILYFRKKMPEYQKNFKRLFNQSLIVLAITLSLCTILEFALSYLVGFLNVRSHNPSYKESMLVSLLLTSVILSIYESIYSFNLFKKSLVQNETLQKENTISQLQSLKSQVNPHFLFNSLNTLTALIPENPDTAVRFVEHLSKVYRYVLEIREKDYIPIIEELKYTESYEFLLKIRFGENIIINKKGIQNNISQFVLPLSIQMLIENAVKHNIISKAKPLTVLIYQEQDYLIVKNNIQIKNQINQSTKTGLLNIKKRYEILTEKKIIVEKTEKEFIVKLPLIIIYNHESINN